MKRAARMVLWVLAALVGLIVILLIVLAIRYSPEYVLRTFRWMEADVYDYQKFDERVMQPDPQPFTFDQPADPQTAAEQVAAIFEQDEIVGEDFEAFLADSGTQAFIVIQDDAILYERYFNGAAHDSIVTSFSIAKSFINAMVGAAIEDGSIASLDEPITAYLPELAERDPRFGNITIRHLLNMSSGIKYAENGMPNGDDALTYYHPDLRWLALNNTRIDGEPGEVWLYNNYHPLLLGIILERATGMRVADYLEQTIWARIGTEYPASWSLDSEDGFEKMESGINARAIDFAKFGRLYLNGGQWEGEQVIPAAWIEATTRIDEAVDRASYYPERMTRPYGQRYHQLMWWGVQQDDGDYGFAARGNHGQELFIWPGKNLIILRHGERYGIPDGDWFGLFVRTADQFD